VGGIDQLRKGQGVTMQALKVISRYRIRSAAGVALVSAAALSACVGDKAGIDDMSSGGEPTQEGTNAAGENGTASAGTAGKTMVSNTAGTSGQPAGSGGTQATTEPGSAGQSTHGGSEAVGGSSSEEMGGAGGAIETGNDDGVHIPPACAYHTSAPPSEAGTGGGGGSGGSGGTAGGGGSGGAANPATVTLQVNAFVGNYLADANGRTLYTYGADLPGDCHTPPQSTCTADCTLTWPPFDAGSRVLAAGLSDAAFGSIERADGTHQTTYMGWPLYYYKSDAALGQVGGQGKGKTWHVAKLNPPAVTIMKAGSVKYLGDAAGHTIYVSAADQAGTADKDPVSACAGDCLKVFEPFDPKAFSVVTSLDTQDFIVFVRKGKGGLQLAYKGLPLYRAATDLKSGDMNGAAVTGFTPAVP
jgi:predicted lipoprotein with Yx(FWY)xxD motif